MTTIRLPWPPTANTYYRHVGARVLISAAGRAYRQRVSVLWMAAGFRRNGPLLGRLAVRVDACPPDRRTRDLSNLLKCLEDSLTHARAWEDDGQIDDLRVVRGDVVRGGHADVRISLITNGD